MKKIIVEHEHFPIDLYNYYINLFESEWLNSIAT